MRQVTQSEMTRMMAMFNITRDASGALASLTMPRPSNFHAHLREKALMEAIAVSIMEHVKYLVVMPNVPLILTMEQALEYYNKLMAIARREGFKRLKLLMTLYHSAQITPAVIEQIARSTVVYAIKRYPLSRVNGKEITTNSSHGIPLDHPLVHEQFVAMEATGVPYLGHFEDDTDKYNRPLPPIEGERQAILETGRRLRDKYKNLKICVEHASVKEAVHFVRSDGSGLTAMTITPHHPTFTLKDYELYGDDLRCKPSIQTEENRNEIWSFMVSGDSRTIAGNDDARHLRSKKKAGATGCALPHSIAMYAARFRDAGALDHRFVRFMCVNGPMWWGLPLPDAGDTITLHVDRERDLPEPTLVPSENDIVTPLGWHEDKAKCFHPGFVVDRPSF